MLGRKLLIGSLCGLVLTACGGGGSGGSSDAENATPAPEGPVDIASFVRLMPGASAQFDVVGKISAGSETMDAEGTFSLSVLPETTFNGQRAYPATQSTTITIPSTGEVITTGATTYVSPTTGQRLGKVKDSGVTCYATSSSAIPTSVEVGDSGFRFQESCSDGSTMTSRWRAEAGDGTLDLVFTFTEESATQSVNELDRYRFDENGNLLALTIQASVSQSGALITMSLSGTPTSLNL